MYLQYLITAYYLKKKKAKISKIESNVAKSRLSSSGGSPHKVCRCIKWEKCFEICTHFELFLTRLMLFPSQPKKVKRTFIFQASKVYKLHAPERRHIHRILLQSFELQRYHWFYLQYLQLYPTLDTTRCTDH